MKYKGGRFSEEHLNEAKKQETHTFEFEASVQLIASLA